MLARVSSGRYEKVHKRNRPFCVWEKEGNKAFGNERLRKTHTPQEKSRHINYLVNILNPRYSEQQLMEMLLEEEPEEDEELA